MELKTNCINCGAVMEYSKQNYGSLYKCPYCNTEHHIDLLGRIEEYKVRFMWYGKIIEAYLSNYGCEYNCDTYCYIEDTGYKTYINPEPTLEFTFIGHVVENE